MSAIERGQKGSFTLRRLRPCERKEPKGGVPTSRRGLGEEVLNKPVGGNGEAVDHDEEAKELLRC